MYYEEMTNTARRIFIASILENEERDYMAVAMIKHFTNNEWNTDDIERVMFSGNK